MKAYILRASYLSTYYVEGVFSSFSAMLTHLAYKYKYTSDYTFSSDGSSGKFKDTCGLGDSTIEWLLSFEVYDVIGEHSPNNNCLKCKGD